MGGIQAYLKKVAEGDAARHADEIRSWSSSIEGAVPIADAPRREPVRIAGIVRRMTVFPVAGREHLEIEVYDGTGEVSAVLMGRRKIGGLTLATHVVVDGVMADQRGELRMMNPKVDVRL